MYRRVAASLALLMVIGLIPPAAADDRSVAPVPELTPSADDALVDALEDGTIDAAEYALERARSLFRPDRVERRYGPLVESDPHNATFVLRDLALRQGELSGDDRRAARRILARPTQEGSGDPSYGSNEVSHRCTESFCVHWVESGKHRIDPDRPRWIDTVVDALEEVVADLETMGYQPVKSDDDSRHPGPNGLPDIYLADLGAGLYGYCTTDDPDADRLGAYGAGDFSAYCVLDNDYARSQFPTNTPTENLKVTAAHEYFHAVQFGYDMLEDIWFMESTAAWIEDVIFDAINDNRQFLTTSAITYPDYPIDFYNNGVLQGLLYGGFLVFRFLSEDVVPGEMREEVVRQIWERAAFRHDHPEDPNDYSMQALERVSRSYGRKWRDRFADFHAQNWRLKSSYEEGKGYKRALSKRGYRPTPWITKSFELGAQVRTTGWVSFKSFHMSANHFRFEPSGSGGRLKIKVDAPGPKTSPRARVVILRRSAPARIVGMKLDDRGEGNRSLPFSARKVRAVVLILVNASSRYSDCGGGRIYSCGGRPIDDGIRYRFKGVLKP